MIRVLLADDHAAIRAGLRMILDTAGDIDVVGEGGHGAGALAPGPPRAAAVVGEDERKPGMGGEAAPAPR
ncbi:response regulator transcription factor, partial [Nocardia carnea]|uniref:response regulator transcription factor n=1 Tax=Nocardia carnea TaxID=37328 RepID=UPI003D77D403